MATRPNPYQWAERTATVVLHDFDIPDADIEVIEYRRDEKIDEAKEAILAFLTENSAHAFYERQLTIIFENRYFHWITVKALLELTDEGSIASELLQLVPGVPIRFFRMKANRYWRRQANKIIKLVRRFSEPTFARAIGLQGELLVDAALPLADFRITARNANSFQERVWSRTNHDLDRIVECHGVSYGVEIKNTLPHRSRRVPHKTRDVLLLGTPSVHSSSLVWHLRTTTTRSSSVVEFHGFSASSTIRSATRNSPIQFSKSSDYLSAVVQGFKMETLRVSSKPHKGQCATTLKASKPDNLVFKGVTRPSFTFIKLGPVLCEFIFKFTVAPPPTESDLALLRVSRLRE